MGKKINIDKMSHQTQLVGYLRNEIIEQLALDVTNKEIVIYPATIKHIRQRHYYAFKKYFYRLTEIIKSPDYIGRVQTNPHKIMIIKTYKDTVLVALKIEENSTVFISSMYIITQSAVEKRIETGGIYKLDLNPIEYVQREYYKNIKRRR